MRMRRHIRSGALLLQDWKRVLVVLLACALAGPASADPPADPVPDVPVAPFVDFKAEYLGALTFTAPSAPQMAAWSVLSTIYAGASLDSPVWELRGVFSTRPGRIQLGACSLVLTGSGPSATTTLTELALLQAGELRDCWTLINTDELRPFPNYFLTPGFIRDRHPISLGVPEYEAFWQTLVLSHYTSGKAFARAARRDVTYANLFNEPEEYRGQVVHISGRLVRLQSFKAPDEARAADVGTFYEGWIMTDSYGDNPVCVAFTDLPAGLKVDNERKYNDEVSFDGYFYKRYRYKAADSKKPNEFRDAPMLIGHTVSGRFNLPADEDKRENDNWGHGLIWVFLTVIGGAVVGIVVLTLWFRYHDSRVHHRLHASRNTDFVPPSQNPLSSADEGAKLEDRDRVEPPIRMPFFDR